MQPIKNEQVTYRNPWWFIPTLYFAQGIPYFLVNQVSVAMFKDLGIPNATITFWTSLLYLPWVIKMFWGPFVDTVSTKRNWILYTQILMSCSFGVVAFSLHLPQFFTISLCVLFVTAFISATHDIAADGFYLLALKPDEQSFFAGIRSTFYRVSNFFSNSFIIWFAGYLITRTKDPKFGWTVAFMLSAGIFAFLFLFHKFRFPYPATDHPASESANGNKETAFLDAFRTYFTQRKIGAILLFILFFRCGESFLIKLAIPFMKDSALKGGLGLSTEQVGIVYGFGVAAIILGGILGGIVVSKYGLKKCLWPMAFIINLPTIMYTIMSFVKPNIIWATIPVGVVPFVLVEQFSYGFGYTALMIYLMFVSKGEYKTSHFAISTGISALGMMLPGLVSGYLQQMLGYQAFFILTILLGIPGLLTLFFIPLEGDGID